MAVRAQRSAGSRVNELGSSQALHLKCALSQVLEECQLNLDAEAGQNQVLGFGYADCRCDQRTCFSPEDLDDVGVVGIGAIGLGRRVAYRFADEIGLRPTGRGGELAQCLDLLVVQVHGGLERAIHIVPPERGRVRAGQVAARSEPAGKRRCQRCKFRASQVNAESCMWRSNLWGPS